MHSLVFAAAALISILNNVYATGSRAVIPVAVINPENGLGGGVKYIDKAFIAPLNYIDLLFYATTRGQASLEGEYRRAHLSGSDWQGRIRGEYFHFPEDFFGFTNSPQKADRQLYVPRGGLLRSDLLHPLRGALNFRLGYQVKVVDILKVTSYPKGEADATILGPDNIGYAGGWGDLIDVGLEYDSRDYENAPTRGWYCGHRLFSSVASQDFRYVRMDSWLAHYGSFGNSWEAAGKVFQQTVLGDYPFYEAPFLGEKRKLRGVPNKRLRDASVQALQGELRKGFYLPFSPWRHLWQVALFAEAGRVGHDFEQASRANMRFSGGAGMRLFLVERLAVIRGDVGFSRYGTGVYLDFGQAF